MASALLQVVVERVAALIEDQIRYQINLVRGAEKELLDLSDKLKKIKRVLADAENRGAKDHSVKCWLKKLEATAYDMDDILDEWNYTLFKHKMKEEASVESEFKQKAGCSFIPSPSCLRFKKVSDRRDISKKIERVKATLDDIFKEKDTFKFVISLPETAATHDSWKVQSTSSIELENVHGLDIDRNKNNIVASLMIDGGDMQIISVVGMGGLGKTTLAQLVYNDTRLEGCFDTKIWICVSDPFDVAKVATDIVDAVGTETIPPNTNQLELVLLKLKASVSGKKFLLVLDDVWTEDYNKWEPLKMNLTYGASGSKILVTTRNERVAKMMGTLDDEVYHPEHLSDAECWSLLRQISLPGRREFECRAFEDVGMKIAVKCRGLPLAVTVLGKLLQFKYSLMEWENVENSQIWQSEVEVELFPHLVLSYNELSPALKRCFSYCSIYPKDYRYRVDHLIEQWMAVGYLGSVRDNGGVELKGQKYLNNLVMRSLFKEYKLKGRGKRIHACKMHDIIHDFATFLRKNEEREEVAEVRNRNCGVCDPHSISQVEKYRSLFWDKGSPHLCDCVASVRVLRLRCLDGFPLGMEKLIHLRWLEVSGINLIEDDLKIICRLFFLQSLLLPECSLLKIPEEIGDLVQIRNLDLSCNDFIDLPGSMCRLVEMEMLNIENCENLETLPEWILQLENLQHLFVEGSFERRESVEGGFERRESVHQVVSQLTSLRTFGRWFTVHGRRENVFEVGNDRAKFEVMKNLNRLTGHLNLRISTGISCGMEELARTAGEAELKKKIHIEHLSIIFDIPGPMMSRDLPESPYWRETIEALEPNQMLEFIEIQGYQGFALPRWMTSPLSLIKEIELSFCGVLSLNLLGKLPLLEGLTLVFLDKMKFLGREFLGMESSSSSSSSSNHVNVVFPKLKLLAFWKCGLEEWEDITEDEEEESANISIMPCLTELTIKWCESLKKLPHGILRKASSSLRILAISGSTELVKTYGEDEEGAAWRSISQHNPQLVLRR
ncbi:putative disease resistance protein RGA3 [Salvia divinorum]|uniref:Disease resistance protein RGA3 n=1 Tax=Salvia divinorum TaxID=28513 RepID=A0ABD1G1Y5_SALDI